MNLKEKIQNRLDDLTANLESQLHLSDKLANRILVEEQIESVAKFWSILDDAERDFINAARMAVEEEQPWK